LYSDNFINAWKHGKVYKKKVDKQISSLKKGSFSQKHKKVDSKFT